MLALILNDNTGQKISEINQKISENRSYLCHYFYHVGWNPL